MSKSLLAVFAHPDDEAFGCGGTLAKYADEGVDVHLLCATRGESGKITDPDIDPDSDVGRLREAELRAACDAMGIAEPIFLDFHDSGRAERTRHDDPKALMNVDELELEAALRPHVARIGPDVMITFDPHGIYGHVDHLRIHRAASAAFWSTTADDGSTVRRLFQTCMSSERMRQMQSARERSPLSQLDPDVYGVGDDAFAAIIDVAPWRDRKERAVSAHRSQVGPQSSFAGMQEGPAREMWEEMYRRETYTLGGLRGAFPAMPVTDLFDGIDAA